MEHSLSIHAAGNTWNPCLVILSERGYELSVEGGDDEDASLVWTAIKGERRFSGYSPPELLGIVTLGERFGHDWNVQKPSVLREVLNR